MMEFFLSKIWLFICGIAVTATLVLAFSATDHSVTDDEAQRRASQMAEILDSVACSPNSVNLTISVGDYLPDDGSVASIAKGYITIVSGTERRYATLHSTILLDGMDGVPSTNCTLVHGDLLRVHKGLVEKGLIHVQVAKERTVSLTA
jgi:hypothetical protein